MSPTSVVSVLALCILDMKIVRPITELPPKPSWVRQAESSSIGSIRIVKKELDERYIHFGILPQNLFFASADRYGYIEVSAKKIVALEKKLTSEIAKQKSLADCVSRNNQGIAFEKDGDIEAAVALYEENIKPGCYPAMHSFDRLLVIYRRMGDYNNELRVCERAISVFKSLDKYTKRLPKIVRLIEKTQK